jgi:glycosyltransferase involved in cell wall biosynthesis
MKIIYVDISVTGHRRTYMQALFDCKDSDKILVVPEKMDFDVKQYFVPPDAVNKKRSVFRYIRWIFRIKKIVSREKPDLVHFLYGDYFYRYFGLLLGIIRSKKIVTIHSVREGFLEKLSLKRLCRKFKASVVHSEYLKNKLTGYGIKNAVHIEYPHFNEIIMTKQDGCRFFDLDPNVKTIVCLGSTRRNKGLDILLEALKHVSEPFQLLIAGQATEITEETIDTEIDVYKDRVRKCLHFLSDDEFAMALAASDIIALPYRKSFNGASGPLGEGAAMGKCILGPSHGVLAETIKTNHLGYVFESENAESLAETLSSALKNEFIIDDAYKDYQHQLSVDSFKEKYQELYNRYDPNV